MHNYVNSAIQAVNITSENKLRLYIPKYKLIEAAGMGPAGCDSRFDEDWVAENGNETHHLVDMSLSFTCASNGQEITGAGITVEQSESAVQLIVVLTSVQAPESCE